MPRFIPLNYQQTSMVVINYLDQLQPGTFEYAIHCLMDEKMDLSVFYPKYQNNETDRPAYNPQTVILLQRKNDSLLRKLLLALANPLFLMR